MSKEQQRKSVSRSAPLASLNWTNPKQPCSIRWRAMLAIASFIIRDPDDLPLHTRVPNLKSRAPLVHSNLTTDPIYRCSKEGWADRPSVGLPHSRSNSKCVGGALVC
jgi:hypothetical protein